MRIHLYWDEKALQQIASDCGNKQLLKDVAFGRFLFHHQKQKLFCEWTDDSFCIGSFCNNHFLIVGLGTRMRARKKGLASMHLNRVINAAIMGGKNNKDKDIYGNRLLSQERISNCWFKGR